MIVTYHTIRRVREDLVSRFCLDGDSRSWTTVARVRENRVFATGDGPSTAWIFSRSRKPRPIRRVRRLA